MQHGNYLDRDKTLESFRNQVLKPWYLNYEINLIVCDQDAIKNVVTVIWPIDNNI